jgi:DNA-directed RNA polymerase subunit H (RpoH/RPB5)
MEMPVKYEVLKNTIRRNGYANIKVSENFTIIVFKEHSSQHCEQAFKDVHSNNYKEILIIYPVKFFTDIQHLKTLNKHVDSVYETKPDTVIWKASQSTFIVNMKTHVSVHQHTVSTKKIGVDIKCEKLPIIFVTDPQAIWCRAKIGDIIEVVRRDQMSGESLNYLEVKAAPTFN